MRACAHAVGAPPAEPAAHHCCGHCYASLTLHAPCSQPPPCPGVVILLLILLSGFAIVRQSIPGWWIWWVLCTML